MLHHDVTPPGAKSRWRAKRASAAALRMLMALGSCSALLDSAQPNHRITVLSPTSYARGANCAGLEEPGARLRVKGAVAKMRKKIGDKGGRGLVSAHVHCERLHGIAVTEIELY